LAKTAETFWRFVWMKQNGFKTVLKPFCFSFISLCGRRYGGR